MYTDIPQVYVFTLGPNFNYSKEYFSACHLGHFYSVSYYWNSFMFLYVAEFIYFFVLLVGI